MKATSKPASGRTHVHASGERVDAFDAIRPEVAGQKRVSTSEDEGRFSTSGTLERRHHPSRGTLMLGKKRK